MTGIIIEPFGSGGIGNVLITTIELEKNKEKGVDVFVQEKLSNLVDYEINESNYLTGYNPVNDTYFLFDLTKQETIIVNAKQLHTDSTGAYTVVVDEQNELKLYSHELGGYVSDYKFGGAKIDSFQTLWLNGKVPIYLVIANGKEFQITQDGLWVGEPFFNKSVITHYEQIYFDPIKDTLSKRILYQNLNKDIPGFDLSFLQNHQEEDYYIDSKHNLIIDNRNKDKLVAIDSVSGEEIEYEGDILSVEIDFATKKLEGILTYSKKTKQVFMRGLNGLEDKDENIEFFNDRYLLELNEDSLEIGDIINNSHYEYGILGLTLDHTVTFDGKNIVFFHSSKNEVIFLDPEHPDKPHYRAIGGGGSGAHFVDIDSLGLKKWQKEVSSHQEEWLAQAQSAYKERYLDIMKEHFSEEYMQALNVEIVPLIDQLFEAQKKEIHARFKKVQDTDTETDLSPPMPFDQFADRLDLLTEFLMPYIEKVKEEFENISVPFDQQKTFLVKLITSVFDLAMNKDISLDKHFSDKDFFTGVFEVMGYAGKIKSSEQFRLISYLIALMKNMPENAKRESIEKIIIFLMQASEKTPGIVEGQVQKFSKHKEFVQTQVLGQWLEAFDEVTEEEILNYMKNPEGEHQLGEAFGFIQYFMNDADLVREETDEERDHFIPKGEEIDLPQGGIDLADIEELMEQLVDSGAEDIDRLQYLIENINNMPTGSKERKQRILNDLSHRESGSSKAEIKQNAQDGGATKLIISPHLHVNEHTGKIDFNEEVYDNGTGASDSVTLLMHGSTKRKGLQLDSTGYFGKGIFMLYEGLDRLIFVNKHKDQAVFFEVEVRRNAEGQPESLYLVRFILVDDENVQIGLKIHSLKKKENIVAEIDQFLSQRAWQVNVGLGQSDDFRIRMRGYDGELKDLYVEHEVLSEIPMTVTDPRIGRKKKVFSRLYSTKNMPPQILQEKGDRVTGMGNKPEFFDLTPEPLRPLRDKLGMNTQMPFSLTGGRNEFAHETELIDEMRKYEIIKFYQAMAYLALTKTSPQFVFEGFSHDWDTNSAYAGIFSGNEDIIHLANQINAGHYDQISTKQFEALLGSSGKAKTSDLYVKLILQLEVETHTEKGRISLMAQRQAIQQKINYAQALAEGRGYQQAGGHISRIPESHTIENAEAKISQGKNMDRAYEQLRHVEEYVFPKENYSSEEQEFVDGIALKVVSLVRGAQVVLVSNTNFAGAFGTYEGQKTIFLNRAIVNDMGQADEYLVSLDKGFNTLIHEIGHLIEEIVNADSLDDFWEKGYVSHEINFTHQSVGVFADAMKYGAGLFLAEEAGLVASPLNITQGTFSTVAIDDQVFGGIDFDLDKINIHRQGTAIKINSPINDQYFIDHPLQGLTPMILNIAPTNLSVLLGLN